MRRLTMLEEALQRMKRIGLIGVGPGGEEIINLFAEKGQVFVSRPGMGNRVGVLSPLNAAEQKLVDKFEDEHGALVYHVIRNEYEVGVCYSFLYVSQDEDEWEKDRNALEGLDPCYYIGRIYPTAYVVNVGYVTEDATELDGNGEFASIGIENGSGGLIRKA